MLKIAEHGELDPIRAELEQTWPDMCQILRVAGDVPDTVGGRVRTRAVVAVVPCRLIPNDRERPIGVEEPQDRPASAARWTVLLPHSQEVRTTDRFLIGGTTYEVIATGERRRSHALCNNVTVRLVE